MAGEATKNDLTERQSEILEYIKNFITEFGSSPTIREIARDNDIKSPNGVMCHLKALARKGAIQRSGYKSRGITLPNKTKQIVVKSGDTIEIGGITIDIKATSLNPGQPITVIMDVASQHSPVVIDNL